MKKSRKIFALLLAFIMIVGQAPATLATENPNPPPDSGINNLSEPDGGSDNDGENPGGGDLTDGTYPDGDGNPGDNDSNEDDDNLDENEDDEDEDLDEDLLFQGFSFDAFSSDVYTYTVDLFSEGSTVPSQPNVRIIDANGNIITPTVTQETITRFRRISFESDSPKVTVELLNYGTDTWGAFASGNDRRIALTSEYHHAYVQRYMPVTFYLGVDADTREVKAAMIKNSTTQFNFWGWLDGGAADFPSVAFGGTDSPVSADLLPHDMGSTTLRQSSRTLGTVTNEDTIYFKIRMEPNTDWGANQWRTLFGTGDNDENAAGDKFARFNIPPVPDLPPDVPAGYYRYNINYFRFNRDSADWNLWYWGVDGQAKNSPLFPAAATSGWSNITFDVEGEAEIHFNLKKGNHWEQRDNLISRTITANPTTRIATVWLIEDRDQILYGAEPDLMTGGVFKQHVRRAWSDTLQTVTARISNIPNAPGSVDVTSTQSLRNNFRLYNHTTGTNVTLTGNVSFTADRVTLTTTADLNPRHHYSVHYNTADTAPNNNTVFAEKVMMRRMLDNFTYTGKLGMIYSPTQTDFKLWAPTAQKVELLIYNTLSETDFKALNQIGGLGTNVTKIKDEKFEAPDATFEMNYNNTNGLWSYTFTGNDILNGTFTNSIFNPGGTSSGFKYYIYRITYADGDSDLAPDPYAIGASPNGWMSAILDLDAAKAIPADGIGKPQNLDSAHHRSATDAILYELHIRDFSMHPTSGISKEHKGKYLAFTEKGTKVQEISGLGAAMTGAYGADGKPISIPNAPSTGIDHLIELGVTHVHLLPAFDYGSVDELRPNNFADNRAFNWGYDPQNYNVPEGNYATDVWDPYVRIREFREMVNALHDAGIKVVMDVVFNHTYSTNDGPFQRAVPGYYYRTGLNTGLYTDGAGCGNEVADERAMVQKFIVDSVLHWQKEYGIDGFRFDLMGLHVESTMEAVSNALRAVDPQVVIYGEPWPGYAWDPGHVIPAGQTPVDRGSQKNKGWSFFNDHFRGPLKGSPDHNDRGPGGEVTDANKGFITGITNHAGAILHGARGWQHPSDGASNIVANASETVNYITAHDNLNLWDKISISFWTNGHPDLMIWDEHKSSPIPTNPPRRPAPGFSSIAEITDRNTGTGQNDGGVRASTQSQLLSAGIIMTSQGVPFFQAGDEFLRTKQGHKNSYNASDLINVINWQDKADYPLVFDYYKGLIEMRNTHPAFRMDNVDIINANWHEIGFTTDGDATSKTGFVNAAGSGAAVPGVVAYRINTGSGANATNDEWDNIYVVYNGNETLNANVNLGHTKPLTRVVNHEEVDLVHGLGKAAVGAWPTVPARSIAVFTDADLEPFTSDYNFIIEIDSTPALTNADIHMWQGGTDLLNSPFKFTWTGTTGRTLAPITAQQLGREFGLIVRGTGQWPGGGNPDNINNAVNGFGNSAANIDRFVTKHPQEPNTKIHLAANSQVIRTYAQAVSFIGINNDLEQEVVFRWRDQERFVDGTPQNQNPVTAPQARYAINNESWLETVTLTYNSTEDMYTFQTDGAGLNAGNTVRYQLSFDGGFTWVEDDYNQVSGLSQLIVAPFKVGFAHPEFNSKQLNVLIVEGLEDVKSVSANLTAFGLNATEDIPLLTLGRFSKVVEPSTALGEKNVDVRITFNDDTFINTSVKTEVVADDITAGFDWGEAIIYFMVTDRFARLDGGNVVTPNSNIVNTRPHEFDNSNVDNRNLGRVNGGDFKGLTASLDYLKELGVNTVWITPIVENIPGSMQPSPDVQEAYHGYWAQTFEKLDERLGTAQDLHDLIDALHSRDMKLMVDIVINHAGYGMTDVHAAASATVPHFVLDNGESMFRPITGEPGNNPIYPPTGNDRTDALAGLPDFRTEDKLVREKLVEWQTYWMSEYNIDYFRVDTVKHVEHETWEALKSRVIEENRDFKMIGELWDGAWNVTGGYLHTGSMDSLVDFPFEGIAIDFVNNSTALSNIQTRLVARETYLHANPKLSLGQFLSNHDRDNTGTKLSGTPAEIDAKLQAAATLQMTAMGQPIIYYGEDVGQYGVDDSGSIAGGAMTWYHPNRYSFDWGKTFNPADPIGEPGNAINQHYRAIINTRAMFSKVYSKGERTYYTNNSNVLAFAATHGTETVLTFINRTASAQTTTLSVSPFTQGTQLLDYYAMIRSGNRGDEIPAGSGGSVTVTVPAMANGGTVVLAVSSKTAPVSADLTYSIPAGHIYSGSAQGIGNVTAKAGITGMGTITVKYNNSTDIPVNAGSYQVTVDIAEGSEFSAITGLPLGNYTIDEKTLTVTPNALSKYFGQTDPALTYGYSGNITGEVPGFNGALSRASGETAATYAIAQNTLALANGSG
ncbi:MAG: alpha-amylase family glycosyl hydrolase, partial [Lachnospiraceae bacterium]|nr:alpha-amylase family glycosyl hydrolase [Lachnospiraceae bacterium]